MSLKNRIALYTFIGLLFYLPGEAQSKKGQISFGSHRLRAEAYSLSQNLLDDLARYSAKGTSPTVDLFLKRIGPELENISFQLLTEGPSPTHLKDLCRTTNGRFETYFSEEDWLHIRERSPGHEQIIALRLYCLSGLEEKDLKDFMFVVDVLYDNM